MGIKFVATFDAVATTVLTDVFEITAPSDQAVIIHEILLSQSSDFGDAQAEILKLQAIHGFTTTGSGGSTLTPAASQSAATANSVVKANNTTGAVTGTTKVVLQDSFNVMIPYIKLWTPETRIELKASKRLVFRLPAPVDSLTLNGSLTFEEIGG